jgi:hypothetical protein
MPFGRVSQAVTDEPPFRIAYENGGVPEGRASELLESPNRNQTFSGGAAGKRKAP